MSRDGGAAATGDNGSVLEMIYVIASEAWQSHAGDTGAIGDCHASLAMTVTG